MYTSVILCFSFIIIIIIIIIIILRERHSNLSSWLSVVPLESHHFDLSPQEFRDALALCYKKPLLDLPPFCDGCGAPFIVC